LATEHLIEVGCKRIAHLRGPDNSPGPGVSRAIKMPWLNTELEVLSGYVSMPRLVDVQSRESGAELMRQLLALDPRPDGVFCYNDPMAIGAIHAILRCGPKGAADIAVIGSGNLHYDTELRIPLSSIDQQTDMIGERAGRLTLSLLESKTHPRNKTIIIQPRLVVRASTDRKAEILTGAAPSNAAPGSKRDQKSRSSCWPIPDYLSCRQRIGPRATHSAKAGVGRSVSLSRYKGRAISSALMRLQPLKLEAKNDFWRLRHMLNQESSIRNQLFAYPRQAYQYPGHCGSRVSLLEGSRDNRYFPWR